MPPLAFPIIFVFGGCRVFGAEGFGFLDAVFAGIVDSLDLSAAGQVAQRGVQTYRWRCRKLARIHGCQTPSFQRLLNLPSQPFRVSLDLLLDAEVVHDPEQCR